MPSDRCGKKKICGVTTRVMVVSPPSRRLNAVVRVEVTTTADGEAVQGDAHDELASICAAQCASGVSCTLETEFATLIA